MFQLITAEWFPALFSLSFSHVLTLALFCSCVLSSKNDSFMRSISSSIHDIWKRNNVDGSLKLKFCFIFYIFTCTGVPFGGKPEKKE